MYIEYRPCTEGIYADLIACFERYKALPEEWQGAQKPLFTCPKDEKMRLRHDAIRRQFVRAEVKYNNNGVVLLNFGITPFELSYAAYEILKRHNWLEPFLEWLMINRMN